MGWERNSNNVKVASQLFNGLRNKARIIAQEETEAMAKSMEYILRHKQQLKGGNGKYPRWDPSPNSNPKSAKSFDKWRAYDTGNGTWNLTNDYRGSDDHNYSFNLAFGTGWNRVISHGKFPTKRLVRKGNLIFSKQLPNGLRPWFKIKRADFEHNLKERLYKEL